MKKPLLLAAAVSLLASVSAPLAVAASAKDKGLEVLISADAIESPDGFRPKPGKPIHYLITLRQQTLGDPVAGIKLPEPRQLHAAVVAELAKQGFIETGVGSAVPDIVIVATVGDANFAPPNISTFANPLLEPDLEPFMRQVNVRQILEANFLSEKVSTNIDALFDPNDPFPSNSPDINDARDLVVNAAIRLRERSGPRGQDRGKLLALLGADKVERAVAERAMSSTAAERIVDASRDNLYYVALSAFNAERWRAKEQVILWRTTMLIDWRKDITKSLSDMLAQAGPMFGTDVPVPGYLNTAQSEGEVKIGNVQVVTDKDAPASATPPSGAKK